MFFLVGGEGVILVRQNAWAEIDESEGSHLRCLSTRFAANGKRGKPSAFPFFNEMSAREGDQALALAFALVFALERSSLVERSLMRVALPVSSRM